MPECMTIVVDARQHEAGKLRYVRAVLADYPGDVPVSVQLLTSTGLTLLDLAEHVEPCDNLYEEMRRLGIVMVPGPVPFTEQPKPSGRERLELLLAKCEREAEEAETDLKRSAYRRIANEARAVLEENRGNDF